MSRMVKRLSNLEIDEISLVDRPANQYGLVEITKADHQEEAMPVYDAEGDEVFAEELEVGDLVYDEDGNQFAVVDDDEGDEYEYEDEDSYDQQELVDVGKARLAGGRAVARGVGAVQSHGNAGAAIAGTRRRPNKNAIRRDWVRARVNEAPGKAKEAASEAKGRARSLNERLGAPLTRWGNRPSVGDKVTYHNAISRDVARHVGRNALGYTVGGGAAVGVGTGGAGYAAYRRKESAAKRYSGAVLSELSKALTDADRDKVIAKAMEDMASVAYENEMLQAQVDNMAAQDEFDEYLAVAKSYGIGDEEEIAGILYRAAQTLPAEDLMALDRYFAGAGEVTKAYFDEVGYNGYESADSVMGQVLAMADTTVGKNADLGLTREQAVTALFEANPDAYDQYEAEQRLR